MHHKKSSRKPEKGCGCEGCEDARRKWAEYMREYGRKNAAAINARRAAKPKTPQQLAAHRERDRKWKERNRERALSQQRERNRKWRAAHPEKSRAAVRSWKERNPEQARKHQREKYARWGERDLQGRKAAKAFQKHRRRGAPGTFTTDQLLARWNYFAGLCWMCRKPADTVDHVIPLSRGGTNWPSNLRPACMDCNRRKYNRRL